MNRCLYLSDESIINSVADAERVVLKEFGLIDVDVFKTEGLHERAE